MLQSVSFIADVAVLPKWLKVRNALDYVEGVHPAFQRERAEQFLAKTDVRMDHKVRELSKGMVTQLHLALVLAIRAQTAGAGRADAGPGPAGAPQLLRHAAQ